MNTRQARVERGTHVLWGHKGLLASLTLPPYPTICGTSPWAEALWARPGSGTVFCVGNFPVVVRWKGGIEFREIRCMGALLQAKISPSYHKRHLLPLVTAKLSSRKIMPT